MRPIFVLLWKHAVVRKRRWCYSTLEFSFSILIMLTYFTKDGDFESTSGRDVERFTRKREPALRRILYTPATNLTDWIMDDVGDKLSISRLNHLPENEEEGIFAVSNERIEDYMTDMQNIDAIVIFQYKAGVWPARLNYTIRLGKDFDSSDPSPLVPRYPFPSYAKRDAFRKDSVDNSTQTRDEYDEHLLRLQWAIDTAYMGLRKGIDTSQMRMPVFLSDSEEPILPKFKPEKIMLAFEVAASCRLALLIIFVFLMTTLINDKNSGIQELMKMEGVSIKTIFLAHFLNVLPGGLIYAIGYPIVLKMSDNDNPIFPHTDSFLIFLTLLLHFLSIILGAYIGAYLINTRILITVTSFFFYIAPMIAFEVIDDSFQNTVDRVAIVLSTGLLPHRPMTWVMTEIGIHEALGNGATFGNMGTVMGSKNGSVLEALVAMMTQTVLFALIAWYLALVRPGKYGQAMPSSFLCQWSYWRKKPEVETVTIDEDIYEPNKEYFEEPPKGMVPGIQIINVTKIFRHNTAVSNLSLNVYKGEITVLLGHNGAGKTTLMNIITGLISASAGKVLVNGMDTSLSRKEVRSQLGLCPQHNLYFADLTVKEHIVFFGLLKGHTYVQVKEDTAELLKMLHVLDKANNMASQLSGGMQRRLQLACALAGGASVLILDEPTSGLDVETRRELWDLLLKLRGTRTVLLTTHFMEEADALADRITAMHAGSLRCHATPMFLKRAVGSGYRLTFTTAGPPNETALTAAIRSVIPEATVRDHALKVISYNLPAKDSAKFSALFSNLEARRSELGIYTIGVGKSNLDEVFMKLCSDVSTTFETDQTPAAPVAVPSFTKLSGSQLRQRQFAYLIRRQVYYITSKMKTFFFFVILYHVIDSFEGKGIICALFVTFAIQFWMYIFAQAFMPLVVIFLLADLCNNKLLYNNGNGTAPPPTAMRRNYSAEDFQPEMDADEIQSRRLDVPTISNSNSTVHVNGTGTNDTNKDPYSLMPPPTTLRLLINALVASTNDTPVQLVTQKKLANPKLSIFMGMWYIMYAIIFTTVLSGYIQLPCTERVTGTRHIHLMCGCSLVLYWTATFVTHVILGTLFLILPHIVGQLVFDGDSTTNQTGFLVFSSLIFLLALLAICPLMYLLSVVLAARVTHTFLIIMNMIFCLVTPILHLSLQLQIQLNQNTADGAWYGICVLISKLVPYHTMVMAISDSGVVARRNAMCKLNKHLCPLPPLKMLTIPNFDSDACCASATGEYASYWLSGKVIPPEGVSNLVFQFIMYSLFLLLADHGVFRKLFDRYRNSKLEPPLPRYEDAVIAAERAYVEETVTKPKNEITDTILCHGVHKRFKPYCGKSYHAVRGINFSVKKGECFGLLGVNGAGKSTTFKMLNAEMIPTRGRIYSNGHFNDLRHKSKYMQTLSYCPQFFGLDDFLTGRQNLELVLTLRGLKPNDVRSEAASWIHEVGLTKHANKRVSTYSGGCARRLAAAAALCQQSDTALLDEPTAGVDIAARRCLQTAILRAKHSKAVIVASHSMDEIEALCDRMIIISAGEICALGSAAELRARYASGYAVTYKLFPEFSIYGTMEVTDQNVPKEKESKPAKVTPIKATNKKQMKDEEIPIEVPTTSKDPAKEAIKRQFMEEMQRKFSKCELKEDHGTMMRYHIKNDMPYSELFRLIEGLKEQFPQLIEDYTLTETTLEEVFLSFAKEALARTK